MSGTISFLGWWGTSAGARLRRLARGPQRIVSAAQFLLLLGIAAELSSRAFWRLSHDVALRRPEDIVYVCYPELRDVARTRPRHSDPYFDILLLGESPLHRDWGNVETELREQLAMRGLAAVRVFNVAVPAQTSHDSWQKYRTLEEAEFEAVVLYHGINEARANNAPARLFRADYHHYAWYESADALMAGRSSTSILPATAAYLVSRVKAGIWSDRYVPPHAPKEEWVRHGDEVKTVISFRRNIEAIVSLAELRGDRIVLMTFASHIPGDYSLEAFRAKRLGYVLHLLPVEVWGSPANIRTALATHNGVIRAIAAAHPGATFVDQAALFPNDGQLFNDPCHLSIAGSHKLAEHLVGSLLGATNRPLTLPPR